MSRFGKLSHVLWCCKYHIVWVPKYRFKVLDGKIGEEVRRNIIIQAERLELRLKRNKMCCSKSQLYDIIILRSFKL